MLRKVDELIGYKLMATDGFLGKARDCIYDYKNWIIRYLAVDTRKGRPGQQVLISPQSLGRPDWSVKVLPVYLTLEQIKKSPPIEAASPLSPPPVTRLTRNFSEPAYRAGGSSQQPGAVESSLTGHHPPEKAPYGKELGEELHWRSCRVTRGCRILASDGGAGSVTDFIFDDETWYIRYLVVNTRRRILGGKSILIAPSWIEKTDWSNAALYVGLTRKSIRESPAYDPLTPVNREYEERLYDFHKKQKYWV